MNKPLLVVVTGRPASGKTTLSRILSQKMKCPLISRDELKEGYINTVGCQIDDSINWHIYNTFFELIELLISKKISIIIEAAFQNKLWKQKLIDLMDKADVRAILCQTSLDITKSRFVERLSREPERERNHGDDLSLLTESNGLLTEGGYEVLDLDIPMLEVDTTKNYKPDIEQIQFFLKQHY
ncbi:AAA family ATPase [Chryseobacterium sediminis]|uniref:ATP-binding protein n=1 Tax=Chryseobacterium sediminis TaxID=1679494 RepID=A0A5B2UBS7_9FLAO|nr:AAA family ATPase [Chryseobacterium sediminis]KAA2223655.1 ATP-binding protein [Chryseobacterium sediminis]